MAFGRINLEQELLKFRNTQTKENDLLEQVQEILKADEKKKDEIFQRLQESGDAGGENNFDFDALESERIFHISHIKKICLNYRLRFLETKYYKAELPAEAISEINRLEKQHKTILKSFRMMAPAGLFKLENADDPILFAPIGNNYFYLIHKWGRDLHPLRRILMWPLKNIENLLVFSFFASFLLTFLIREIFFPTHQTTTEFLLLFFFDFKSVLGLTFFYGIALGKNFSSGNWNSKFFN